MISSSDLFTFKRNDTFPVPAILGVYLNVEKISAIVYQSSGGSRGMLSYYICS
jgi:hypothetical protein